MSDGRLNAVPDRYLQAAALNSAPPPVRSDELADGATPVEQLLRILGLAANADDVTDGSTSAEGHAQREAGTTGAAATFPGQDGAAAGQIISGVAGSLAGLLQPLAQLPQQFAQGAQQAVQAAGSPTVSAEPADVTDEQITDTAPDPADDAAGLGTDPMAVSPDSGITTPSAVLSPAVIPSPATHPSAAPGPAPSPAQANPKSAAPASAPVMTGMPMVPPAGLGTAGMSAVESKTDTKRVSVPSVRNGAGVQGRIGVAGPVVTTRIDGKPVAVGRAPATEPE